MQTIVVNNKRVYYAIMYNLRNKVFIEVKSVSENLEKHQELLLDCSIQEGVKLAILTNWISWMILLLFVLLNDKFKKILLYYSDKL